MTGVVIWNPISNLEKVKGKKNKIITLHVLEKNLKQFAKKLKIEHIKPDRGVDCNLLDGINKLNMPEYKNEDLPLQLNPIFKFHIMSDKDHDELNRLLDLNLSYACRHYWYPERPVHKWDGMEYITDEPIQSECPIYIISKGRAESRYTVKSLEKMNVDYKIVIEPQEFKDYNKYIDKKNILILPPEYLNKNSGGIPARNFCWQHSIDNGFKYHWILDDNIDGFYRWNQNKRLPLKSGIGFKMIEDYMLMHDNLALCGMQYVSFMPEISLNRQLYVKNTRIYSCILIKNDLDERWRGKYNEDTDLSLRLLKKCWSTLLFHNFLCHKKPTLSVKGGNSEIYSGDGLQKKLDSLIEQHPEYVKGIIKFKKVHHQVDYSSFKNNKLILKKDIKIPVYPEIKLVKSFDVSSDISDDSDDENDNNYNIKDIVKDLIKTNPEILDDDEIEIIENDYVIAIPSYDRIEYLKSKTLKMLQDQNINKNKIYIFVANDIEYKKYKKEFGNYNIVIGKLGLVNQLNFITDYFDENQKIMVLQDDIDSIWKKKWKKTDDVTRKQMDEIVGVNLDQFFNDGFNKLKELKLNFFGINKVSNCFLMGDGYSTDLRLIVGVVYGYINKKKYKNKIIDNDTVQDIETSIIYFKKDGGILRYNDVGFTSKYMINGGIKTLLGSNEKRLEMIKDGNKRIMELYPGYGKIVANNRQGEVIKLNRFVKVKD